MKTKNKIFFLVIIGIAFASCADYLDVSHYFEETGTLGAAFKKRNYTEGFFSNAYEVMYDELADVTIGGKGGYSMWASDDLLRMNDGQLSKKYQNGEYSSNDLLRENDKWKRVYETIRKSSTFLQYVDSCEEMTMNERSEYKAQAHFLRGYAYWILLREYGPIPIMPEYGLDINLSYEEMAVPRNTFEECVDYIADEFLIAARNLPLTWPANNIGRPTRGAALAARARVYLLAASPLFNRDGQELFDLKDHEGKQLIPQEYDESKWARAAVASLDVMNLGEGKQYALYTVAKNDATIAPPFHPEYSAKNFPEGWADIDPFLSYRELFDGSISASKNKEIIFTRPNDNKDGIRQLVEQAMPYSLGGSNAVAVTLKQVNAYYRHDGKTVDEAKAANEYDYDLAETDNQKRTTTTTQFPYVGRMVSLKFVNLEPRFYASIAYPGSIWECESNSETAYKNQQVFYYQGQPSPNTGNGNERNNPESFPITGIGLKKYYNPEDGNSSYGGYMTEKFEPGIRYADVLLWYAEALNELTSAYTMQSWNGEDIVVNRVVAELQRGMKPVRMRAGLPDFSDEIYNSRDAFRTKLKQERQIEFFAENKRYYDLRRWRDAQIQENIPISGFNTDISATNWLKFYEEEISLTSVFPKYFTQRMYLWPIPEYEMKRNKKLTQNPGW